VRRLLLLYPRSWRERYQAEMEAVLDGIPFDPRAAFDLVACAADAHLHPQGGRRIAPPPLLVQLALLGVLGLVAFPLLERLVEAPFLRAGNAFLAYELVPSAVPALAALVSWRTGWRLAAWFCALLAVQLALTGEGSMWALTFGAQRLLEPLRLAATAWHPAWFRLAWPAAAAMVVVCGALSALLLRRLGTSWPIGLCIGVALAGTADVWVLYTYLPPHFTIWPSHPTWFRLMWLVEPTQVLAWGGLTAGFLRRAGLTWWASLLAGCVLWLALGSSKFSPGYSGLLNGPLSAAQFIPLWQLPAAAWAVAVAALVSWRAAEPAPLEVVPC
jgi:hypothetical protein